MGLSAGAQLLGRSAEKKAGPGYVVWLRRRTLGCLPRQTGFRAQGMFILSLQPVSSHHPPLPSLSPFLPPALLRHATPLTTLPTPPISLPLPFSPLGLIQSKGFFFF